MLICLKHNKNNVFLITIIFKVETKEHHYRYCLVLAQKFKRRAILMVTVSIKIITNIIFYNSNSYLFKLIKLFYNILINYLVKLAVSY
jgi:hypothetical protein